MYLKGAELLIYLIKISYPTGSGGAQAGARHHHGLPRRPGECREWCRPVILCVDVLVFIRLELFVAIYSLCRFP